MKKKSIFVIILVGLLLCALLFFFITNKLEADKVERLEGQFRGLYVRDTLEPRQSITSDDLDSLEESVNELKDEGLKEGYLQEISDLRKLIVLREEIKEVELRPIQDFSGEKYRALLVQVNEIQDLSIRERETLYALKKDYDAYEASTKKLENLSALTEEILNIDSTNPEEVKRVLDTIKAAGAEDLLEDHMGDLWERYALAESLEDYLNKTGNFTPEDAKAFTELLSSMQKKGMKVDDYLELSRVMSLLTKVGEVGLLGLSRTEFFELLEFYNSLDSHERNLLAQPLMREIEKQLGNLLGNLG